MDEGRGFVESVDVRSTGAVVTAQAVESKCSKCGHRDHGTHDCDWELGGNQWNPAAYCWCRGTWVDGLSVVEQDRLDNLPLNIAAIFFWVAVYLIARHFIGWLP